MKPLISDLPKKDAIIQFKDKTTLKLSGVQGHWDEDDVICLCLDVKDWAKVERVLFY